ncbi:MAG TPA: hypothetical protein VHA12_02455 [Candidatus Nanoarchaeia archaeon]|nr:hypothetical protein [Candidatus Nanoarchaeia archaeon]
MKQKNTSIIVIICIAVIALNLFFAIDIISKNYSFSSSNPPDSLNKLRVIDGDTFTYKDEVIRLLCVQTPEINRPGYKQASLYLSSLLSQGEITLKQQDNLDKGRYNRSLRFVYVKTPNSTLFVNKLIVDNGFGFLFPYNNTNCSLLS